MKSKKNFAVFTPGGTCVALGFKEKEKAKSFLIKNAAHMPYGTWRNFHKRGYRIEEIVMKEEKK